MLRIGVIGAGSHSTSSHGPPLEALRDERPGGIELAAVCDLDRAKAEAYARRFGFAKTYTDLDAMLDGERLDGLVAVTAIGQTAALAGRLLATGIPLLIEKPPGASCEETCRLLSIARERGAPHMVSLNRRFNPALTRARDWLRGQVSTRPPIATLACMLRQDRREERFAWYTGIHTIDAVFSLLGRPGRIDVRRLRSRTPSFWGWSAAARFAGGTRADIILAPQAGAMAEIYDLYGPGYAVRIDVPACSVRIVDRGEVVLSWQSPEGEPGWVRDGSLQETRAFLNAVEGKGEFAPDLEDGLVSMQAAEAVENGEGIEFVSNGPQIEEAHGKGEA